MKLATEVLKEVVEVTAWPTVVFGYQMPGEEPIIFARHVDNIKSQGSAVEKVWSLVLGYADNYDTGTFQLKSPAVNRPFFGDAQRSPWTFEEQDRAKPFVFAGLLTESSNFVWGADIPRGDGWGFCERVAEQAFGNDAAEKVAEVLKAVLGARQ